MWVSILVMIRETKRKIQLTVGHFVNTRVGEVGEDVGEVETSHGQLGDDHFREGREGGEDALAVSLEGTEAGSSREVAALHDTTGNEDPVGRGKTCRGERDGQRLRR